MIKVYILEELAKYIVNYKIENVDESIIAKAKLFFADGLACMIAAVNEKPVAVAERYAELYSGQEEATIIASGRKTDAMTAAMANGMAAHYLDFDDVADSTNAHVSVVMIPTVLATGEQQNSSGKDLLEAYMLGIEACSIIGRTLGKENFRKGWHSTASLGIFGAAAAAAKLLGLNEKQVVNTLALAASESSGIKANFGTMAKCFHAGSAASKGIRCARLAGLGMDARADAMENKCGFGDLTNDIRDFTPSFEAIEKNYSEFIDPGLIMKPYPSCKGTHNGIDAAIELTKEFDLHTDDIESVCVEVQPYVMDIVRYPDPKTKLQGKFSLNYTVALGISKRSVVLEDFEGPDVFSDDVIKLIPRIKVIPNENMNNGETMLVRGDTIVTIKTTNGNSYSKRVNYALGDPHNPMPESMRMKKLVTCFTRKLSSEKTERLINILSKIEDLNSVNELISALI